MDARFVVQPGSGGVMEFAQNTEYRLAAIIVGTVAPDGDAPFTTNIELDGEVTGYYEADRSQLFITREAAAIRGKATVGEIEIDLNDMGEFHMVQTQPTTTVTYECYETGVLSLYWPTGIGDTTELIDLVRRGD